MNTTRLKKLLILNTPYVVIGLYATKLGEAWRLAEGTDASNKFLHLMDGLSAAFRSPFPSLYPADLLIGIVVGCLLRLAVYEKGRNAKKYRHNVEYGSARWGTHSDIAPFIDPDPWNNVILTKTESLTMNSRPKAPRNARNRNVLVVGGSGSGKTRFLSSPTSCNAQRRREPLWSSPIPRGRWSLSAARCWSQLVMSFVFSTRSTSKNPCTITLSRIYAAKQTF